MSLIDLITYGAVILYLLLGWLGRSRRQTRENDTTPAKQKREPSLQELQAWRQSLGPPEQQQEKRHRSPALVQTHAGATPRAKEVKPPRIQHPKAPTHERRMPHNFRFQATLDKYRRASGIDTRDYSSRIEGRKAPGREMVSMQLKDDAPEDAYAMDKEQEKSIGWRVLHELSSKKDLIVICELLGKPRCYLAPTRFPGYWWESVQR